MKRRAGGSTNGSAAGPVPGEDRRRRWTVGRIVLLAVTALCLYVLAPSIAEVFEAWDRLGEVHPGAILLVLACEVASFACVWLLQAIALRTGDWFSVITTQLAGNAFNRITPGGGATGTALQARMLADAGFDTTKAATALTVQSVLVTAAVVAMPVFALPAIVAGTSVPAGLGHAVWIGFAVFGVMLVVGALFLGTRRPVVFLGETIDAVRNRFHRDGPVRGGLGHRLVAERDEVRETLGSRWPEALGAAVGRWAFEYLALLVTLYVIGADPDPWLVLFAFVGASVLGLLPFTPGGLGFVEAGLTATLALAGIEATAAVLATLVYRLVSFWLPLPIGFVASVMYRRRHPRQARSA